MRRSFAGRPSRFQIYGSLAKATIVPSICPETFGLTCVESLQAGTPVIASRFGALPELVADTGGGAVYGDTRELEAILDGIDHDPDRWVRLGKMGKSRLDKYSAQSHLENYFRIIDAVRPARANTP
jgi:glycosyltransferase involved in cell wall biosynthesis